MIEIDARGLRCPWPALRLARAMRGADAVRIAADDPAAPRELTALAGEHGWTIAAGGGWFIVEKKPTPR